MFRCILYKISAIDFGSILAATKYLYFHILAIAVEEYIWMAVILLHLAVYWVSNPV